MTQTKLANLVNPEVMAQMISTSLPKKIKFSPVAKIDTTLTARAGNTITVPKFAYIGDAEDVADGVAMGTALLTVSKDHPRLCGDYMADNRENGFAIGSPPLVRGLLRLNSSRGGHQRITPACAGTTVA